jgi:uncharacterized protein YifE (UPF0438 family)
MKARLARSTRRSSRRMFFTSQRPKVINELGLVLFCSDEEWAVTDEERTWSLNSHFSVLALDFGC